MNTILERAGVKDGRFTREFAVRTANQDAREFTGVGVPWGEVVNHYFGDETFDRGSVTIADQSALVMWQHREPIGLVTSGTDTDAGYEISGRISDTTQGREAYTLLKDQVITCLSIGFEPVEYRVDENDVTHWTRVIAREFSLVSFPAYNAAQITNVRHRNQQKETTTMDPDTLTRADLEAALNPLNAQMDEFQRGLAGVGRTPQPTSGAQYRSLGHLLKEIASGNSEAAEFHRAYTGGTTADTIMNPGVVGEFIKLVQMRRRIVSMFKTDVLPSTGVSVDYYQLNADATAVGKQNSQGDDLAKGKVTLKKANTAVDTYGGWTELSRQEVERATVPILDITLKALGIRYANLTETAGKTVLQNQITANLLVAGNFVALGDVLATATTSQWLTSLVSLAENFDSKGFLFKGLACSKDVFLQLMNLTDGANRRLMNVYGDGLDKIGAIDIPGLSGAVGGIPVQMIPNAAGSWITAYDPEAIITLESPGAPAQLQDENIVNLSKQFSLYGYCAQIVPFPAAIVPIKLSA